MDIELRHFSYVPQIAVSLLGVFLGVTARDPMTTYLGCCVLTVCFVINILAVAYCSFCMEKGLTIRKIHYYEKTALLWESVAEELRKEGKFACLDTFADNLVQATKERDKQ